MTRFPDAPIRPASDGPPDAGEERALLALAEELRAAHADPAAPEDFGAAVLERLNRPSLRSLLRSSRWARAAAAVFVVTMSVAPVLALAQIVPWLQERQLVIRVERLLPPPPVEPTAAPEPPQVPQPPDPAAADPAFVESVMRRNRLALAAASWSEAGAGRPEPRGAAPAAWSEATAEDLWQEFVRRCADPGSGALPPGLVARIEALEVVGGAEERRLLAPWIWVLRGSAQPAAEAAGRTVWPAAPWIAAE